MSDEFDFIKAFADVDLLAVEAMGTVIGRAIGALHTGMTGAGLTDVQANYIIKLAMAELVQGLRPS